MAVFVLTQILSRNMNQTLADAARGLPDVVAYYTARDGSLDRASPAIVAHLATEGVRGLVMPRGRFALFPGAARFPPLLPPPSLFLAAGHRIRVEVPGAIVLLTIDPQRFAWADAYFPTLVGGIFLIVVGAGTAVGLSTVRRVLEPLARTTAALTRLGEGDFQVEAVRTQDPSELGQLARAYNKAVAAVRAAFHERERAEAEMQQFVADAGHQLRTPLTVIMGHLSAWTLPQSDRRTEAALDNMLTESRRMRGLIEDLILLTRLEEARETPESIDLRSLLVEFVGRQRVENGPEIRLGQLDEGFVRARGSDIHNALTALIDNAKKYAPGSPIDIDLRQIGSTLQLRVMDRGPGMTTEDLAHALDRFYRGQAGATAPGSGLGLAIIRRIMHRSGGSIVVQNRSLGGLECTLYFSPLELLSPSRADYAEAAQVV